MKQVPLDPQGQEGGGEGGGRERRRPARRVRRRPGDPGGGRGQGGEAAAVRGRLRGRGAPHVPGTEFVHRWHSQLTLLSTNCDTVTAVG